MELHFYLLKRIVDFQALDLWLCRWLEQRYLAGDSVVVLLQNEERLCSLNRLLWVFRDCSLVPHCTFCTNWNVDDYPIVLVTVDQLTGDLLSRKIPWLVNLGEQSLVLTTIQIPQIVELVPNIPNIRSRMRIFYRDYVRQGVRPVTDEFD